MAARFFQLCVLDRKSILEWGESHVYHRGVIPAPRGRILSSDGFALFYSERRFQLRYRGSRHLKGKMFDRFQEAVCQAVPRADFSAATLVYDLTPGEIGAVSPLMSRYPELSIASTLERKCALPSPELARRGGKVRRNRDRSLSGVSGWEKEFDAELTGKNGSFEVRYDRYGNWIGGTLRITSQPIPGKDVVVPLKLSEIRE